LSLSSQKFEKSSYIIWDVFTQGVSDLLESAPFCISIVLFQQYQNTVMLSSPHNYHNGKIGIPPKATPRSSPPPVFAVAQIQRGKAWESWAHSVSGSINTTVVWDAACKSVQSVNCSSRDHPRVLRFYPFVSTTSPKPSPLYLHTASNQRPGN